MRLLVWAQVDPDKACDGRAIGSASLPNETVCSVHTKTFN